MLKPPSGRCFGYDWANGFVAPHVGVELSALQAALNATCVGDSEADTLVDLGCGDGRVVIEAAKRGVSRAVGVDIDENLLRDAAENAAAAGENVRARVEWRSCNMATRLEGMVHLPSSCTAHPKQCTVRSLR